VGFSIDFAYGP